MNGKNIYEKLSIRDYSGSDQDVYAQLLNSLHVQAVLNGHVDEFYTLLEKADSEGKKLTVIDSDLEELFIESISLS